MQDEVNEKVVSLAIKTSKLTAEVLQKAMKALLAKGKGQLTKAPHGKITMRQLMKPGEKVSNIEITDQNIKAFDPIARKNGLDYNVKKIENGKPPTYLVSFKGRFASSRALAAVGSNSSLIALMINLFIGISLGSNVIISRYIGQKAEEHVKGAIHTAIVVALCSGIFVLVLGQFIARPVLTLMGTPKDVIDLAVLYLRIYFLGMPFIMLYDFSSSILRSIGDSRRPLYALIAAGIINTGLNLILVIVFHLGVSGVAIATVVSNIVSSGILFYILLHEQEPIRVRLCGLSIDWGELKKILIIGVPAGLQGMVFSLANVCIQSMINSFGSNAIAGSAAALNFEFFAYFMVNAFAQTTVTFTSQNYGAGDFQRCKKVYRLCMTFSVIFCGLLSGVFVLGRDFFVRLYTTDPNVLTFAVQRLLIVTTLELLTSTYEISGGAMRGFGHSLTPALITVVGSCVLRLIWINTVCRAVHEFWVVMIIYPISWVLTGTAMITAYLLLRRKLMR